MPAGSEAASETSHLEGEPVLGPGEGMEDGGDMGSKAALDHVVRLGSQSTSSLPSQAFWS